jgi:flagellar biogenesis protein FliO
MTRMLLTFFCFLTSFSLWAGVKLNDIELQNQGENLILKLNMKQTTKDLPELLIRDKMIQVSLPNSFVWPKIEKTISLKQAYDTKILAYQFDKETVRVRAMLPYSLNGKETSVNLIVKGKDFYVSLPKPKGVALLLPAGGKIKLKRAPAIVKRKDNAQKIKKQIYDEKYLAELLKDKEMAPDLPKEVTSDFSQQNDTTMAGTQEKTKQDMVKSALSGTKKDAKSPFSLAGYIGKFVAFLALVLVLFYGLVTVLKKGAFRKGKLGFLNSTKAVEVLSTTYIAPKRSLLLIKAHNQVFLVGSSEGGLNLISEVNGTAGVIKEGEAAIAGDNFDTNLNVANVNEKDFKLKDILSSEKDLAGTQYLPDHLKEKSAQKTKDKVSLSDQIKHKVKGLKPLQ